MGRYLADPFTDSNGTLLTAHTIPTKRGSQTWAYSDSYGGGGGGASSVTIQSNQCQFASAQSTILVDALVADYTEKVNWVISGTTGHRLAIPFRYTDINNHYYLNLREPNDDWTIYKIASGVQTTVATGFKTFNTSTTYGVKIVVSGTSVHVYIDDVSLTGAVTLDAHLTATTCGLGVATIATNVTLDNFEVNNGVTNTVSGESIKPGTNHALTFAGFVAAPSTITYNSVSEAFTGTPTTSAGTMLAIPLTDFAPASHHVATRWQANNTLTVSDGIDSASATIQVDPDVTASEDFTQTSGASDVDDYNPITGAVGGDDFFAYWSDGDGVRDETIIGTAEAGSGYMSPVTLPAMGHRRAYDVSGSAWLAEVSTPLYEAPASGVVEGIVMAVVRPIVKSVVEAIT